MNLNRLTPVTDPGQVPADMTEEEARAFWDTHSLTEELLAQSGPVDDAELPPVRDRDELLVPVSPLIARRLRALARRRKTRLKDLVEALLSERLSEEERRGA